ncbi:hypothetical protein T492DRAFT_891967 [Pavlovales sp. CCMP2436]|nr:hypothetical protein T492DRAFT_891967 [Pavlovales sp. CCMP2436]
MRGEKRVAIISEAASAGISLHADLAFANTQPRMHITMELAWSAEKQLQQFGRTHRARQAQPPHYKLLVSDVGGEARFAATIAKRLAVLGAITRGDRRGASGASFAQFDFDSVHGHRALELLLVAIGDGACEQRLWERFRHFFEAKGAQNQAALAQAQAASNLAAADGNASPAELAAATAAALTAATHAAAAAPVTAGSARAVLPLRNLCRLALARSLESTASLKGKLPDKDANAVVALRANAERQRTSHDLTRLHSVVRLVPPSEAGALVSVRFFDEAAEWLLQMRLADPTSGYVPDGPERRNVPKFLNRMLGLPVQAQRQLLDAYAALLAALRG